MATKTKKIGNTEYYKGISIKKSPSGKWVGRKNRKWFASGNTKAALLLSIDNRVENVEYSKKVIQSQGKSKNPNVRR